MKALTVLSGLLIIANSLYSQTIAFPDSFALWYDQTEEISVEPGHGATFVILKCHLFEMNGDTVLNSKDYKKIYLYDDSLLTKTFYVGIRSDSLNRVFVFVPDSSIEYIIYDFNFVEGDTVTITSPSSYYSSGSWHNTANIIIGDVDTVFLYGAMRKRAIVYTPFGTYWDTPYWIEGVGSSQGLLYYEFESSAKRTSSGCKVLKDFSLTSTLNYTCRDSLCFYWVGIDEIPINAPHIFPNPLLNDNKLIINIGERESFQISITNILGQVVYQAQYHFESEVVIQPKLDAGIYLIHVSINGRTFTKKVIKI